MQSSYAFRKAVAIGGQPGSILGGIFATSRPNAILRHQSSDIRIIPRHARRRGYAWPSAPRDPSVDAAIAVFIGQGFEKCATADFEPGWEKVAIYGDNSGYTHAAKQTESGRWSSKLGKLEDIEHAWLEDLAIGDYDKSRRS